MGSQLGNSDSSAHQPTLATFVIAIGGMDPGAGAGLGRDLLTARALGAAVRLVGTAWTEQDPASGSEQTSVRAVEPRAADALERGVRYAVQLCAMSARTAVKIGMVTGAEQVGAILRGLEEFRGPVVVDPVLAASGGGALWQGSSSGLMPLLRRATLVTPNAPEAEILSGAGPIHTVADAAAAARRLRAAGMAAVLVKGGHLHAADGASTVTDVLSTTGGETLFSRPRVAGPSPRGTGCALATALAFHLAGGLDLPEAARRATTWLAEQITAAKAVGAERHLGT